MKLSLRLLLCVPFSLLTMGCSSLNYEDATDEETVNIDWGSTDLQTFAARMVGDLSTAPGLNFIKSADKGDDPRIIVYLDNVYNETQEHINMGLLRDKMLGPLIESGRFRIVAGKKGQDELGEQVRFQQGSGRVDPAQAKAFGKQLGADVVIYGALRAITKKKGRSLASAGSKTKDVYYNLFLRMDNIETAETMWAKDHEIRKREVTGLFGR
ncbi:MAG: hypothetical protein ACI8QC_004266 [Planctomycetota bacterium]|jgi:uncharacterized protein (TIGR02722 family)